MKKHKRHHIAQVTTKRAIFDNGSSNNGSSNNGYSGHNSSRNRLQQPRPGYWERRWLWAERYSRIHSTPDEIEVLVAELNSILLRYGRSGKRWERIYRRLNKALFQDSLYVAFNSADDHLVRQQRAELHHMHHLYRQSFGGLVRSCPVSVGSDAELLGLWQRLKELRVYLHEIALHYHVAPEEDVPFKQKTVAGQLGQLAASLDNELFMPDRRIEFRIFTRLQGYREWEQVNKKLEADVNRWRKKYKHLIGPQEKA